MKAENTGERIVRVNIAGENMAGGNIAGENIEGLVLKANNFSDFNILQKKCIPKIEKNLLVSAPTASGKTIIAELLMLKNALKENKKVIYTCPLKALASEHYNDFKKKYPMLKFALSTGDLDSSSSYLKKFDVIFTTFEKLSSLLRHRADWLSRVGCLIVDEIHEIDSDRGPVIETTITQLRNMQKIQLLALSATINNAREISDWLGAELIESDYRPTTLFEGISLEKTIEYNNGFLEDLSIEELVEKNVGNKQFIFFMNSRKRAESQSKKISKTTEKNLVEKDREKLKKISEKILGVLETPTEQCHNLSESVGKGCAFHHAGLLQKQRELVEKNFKNGLIRVICSTTTLSAGINTPADFVVIPSLYRYSSRGMVLIPVREYKQCAGRAGRPKFSTEGKSIIVSSNENQKDFFLEQFVNGEVEPVTSRLGEESVLRTMILGLIATNTIFDEKSVWSFFEKTLYAKQSGSVFEIYEKALDVVKQLEEFGFVKKENKIISCTLIGKRVSDLFLDPSSAFELLQALKSEKSFSEMSYLYAWCNCTEFSPKLRIPSKSKKIIFEEFQDRIREIPFSEEKIFFEHDSVETFFSALVLEKWVSEFSEQKLFEDFNLAPGALFGKTRVIEWLAYSTIELSKTIGVEKHFSPSKKLSLRVKHGVREELLPLVELKGVGRVRARKLFRAGIKSPSQLKKNPVKAESVLGKNVFEKIFNYL